MEMRFHLTVVLFHLKLYTIRKKASFASADCEKEEFD